MDTSSNEFRNLQRQVEEIYTKIKDFGEDGLEIVEDDAKQTIANLKAKLRVARDQIVSTGHKADDYAHENPWQIAAGGVVVGILVGMLISRKR